MPQRIRPGRVVVALIVAAVLVGGGLQFLVGEKGSPRLPAQVGNEPLCDPRFCGNNQPDPGEQCDDGGNVPGDGCDALCRIECTLDEECPSGECAGGICANLCGNSIVNGIVCTETGVCSQPEECDEGPFNGEQGGCTIRCTFCGNGVIDTVNGVTEECDAGTNNGDPASGCSNRCKVDQPRPACNNDNICQASENCQCLDCTADVRCSQCDNDNSCEENESCSCGDCKGEASCQTHTECNDSRTACISVPGGGPNLCTDPVVDCAEDTHLECVDEACAEVDGPGRNTCTVGFPEDCDGPHRKCNFAFQTCELDPVPAQDECVDGQCHGDKLVCSFNECTLAGQDDPRPSCLTAADCDDTISCNDDNICQDTESCACGDCIGDLRCLPRLGCTGVGQCALVPADSTSPTCGNPDDCCDPSDPSCGHLECSGSFQCVPIAGPGGDECATNPDCTPCPASNPNCHEQCNELAGLCEATPTGSCDSATCGTQQFKLACVSEQCTVVEGSGPNECDGPEACAPPTCNLDNICQDTESCSCGDCTDAPRCAPRLGCTGVRQCALVSADSTVPSCGNADDCCDPSDPACKHALCDEVTFRCAELDGPGPSDCTSDVDCAPCPASNPNCHTQCDVFVAQCIATPLGACVTDECTPKYLACENEQCTLKEGNLPNECEGPNDCIVCGNGRIDPGEICDAGPDNRTDPPSDLGEAYCKGLQCLWTACGDGSDNDQDQLSDLLDGGCWEYRRPGGLGLQASLLAQASGDPAVPERPLMGKDDEQCPADMVDRGNFCLWQCTPGTICPGGETCPRDGVCPQPCPNGAIDGGEECDDNNYVDDDLCSNICRLNPCTGPNCPRCGDGVHQPNIGEQCDDGNTNDNDQCTNTCRVICVDDGDCDGRCDPSTNLCLPPVCGDTDVNQPWERCDDGNLVDTDSCNNQCQPVCDQDADCAEGRCDEALQVCTSPVCGDGFTDFPDEQCDDGNRIDNDTCSNVCVSRCSPGQQCPSGLLCDGNTCRECVSSLQCQSGFCVDGRCRGGLPLCGNGMPDPGEVCDDANRNDGDGCTVNCLLPINSACTSSTQCQTHRCSGGMCQPCGDASQCATGLRCAQGNCLFGSLQCGDGTVQAGEACDDANFNEMDSCTTSCLKGLNEACTHASQCQSTICQNGSCTACKDDGECSQGRRCALGMCLTDAQMSLLPNICGNALLEVGEACDDGNARYGDGCTPNCDLGNAVVRQEVAADVTVQLPFTTTRPGGSQLHAGGDNLADTGPATIAVMAAGAAAGTAWVRRRMRRKKD